MFDCEERQAIYGYKLLVYMRFHKIVKSDYYLRHVCPSVRMEHLGSHWIDFY